VFAVVRSVRHQFTGLHHRTRQSIPGTRSQVYSRRMQGYDDPGGPTDEPWDGEGPVELIEPDDFLPANPFPLDAQRMGIDRWSDNAGMIAVAASLDPAKPWHKVIAWLMLVGVVLPLALNLWAQLT
jgi:hypothetical protein